MRLRLLPRSLAGRMAIILIAGIVLVHVISLGSYDLDRVAVLEDHGMDRFADRVTSSVRLAESSPSGDRAGAIKKLTYPGMAIELSDRALVDHAGTGEASLQLADKLADWLSVSGTRIRVDQDAAHDTLVSIQLDDGSWNNARSGPFGGDEGDLPRLVVSTSLAAIGILAFSLVMVRWITSPLRQLADAAERLGTKLDSPPLVETGSVEVRQATAAFNRMQSRVQRFLGERTQMFAAISHDLKTPITRLKLRAEFALDEADRLRMLRDLDDMEQMIGSLLAFLRDETGAEEPRLVDIAALARTICDGFCDAGHTVVLEPAAHNPTLLCRASALRRAISNVVDNAVKYGGVANVRVFDASGVVRIEISDQGPGIPEDKLDMVFTPFYRLEESRNRDTGGTGLGLTIARTIVHGHGGDMTLRNLSPRGLLVTMSLPLATS